jgi:pantoate--beta-alanine ligase
VEDIALLSAEGVEIAFTPSAAEMYGDEALVTVDPGPLAERWEGAVRPGHFRGVATIVTKLLSVVSPDLAFFGEKDYQQLQVVKRLVHDLDLGCAIVACPVVREPSGLALSSRNANLSEAEYDVAHALPAALLAAEESVAWGERDAEAICGTMRSVAETRSAGALALDYAAVVDPDTLVPLSRIDGTARALIAGRVGSTHLIDTCALEIKE